MNKLMMAATAAMLALTADAAILKNGDTVAFMGDSITQQGWGRGGYVRMCEAAFKANGLDVKIIPAGISGHKSNQMLARLEKDVLEKKPTYMTLSCGVNDVWHGAGGVPLAQYKENIAKIVEKTLAAGVKPIILTATMIGEDAENDNNKKLAAYNDFLRAFAKEKSLTLVDLNAIMQREVADCRAKNGNKGTCRTTDGVHMNFLGNRMMTTAILKDGFKFSADELTKAGVAIEAMTAPSRQ